MHSSDICKFAPLFTIPFNSLVHFDGKVKKCNVNQFYSLKCTWLITVVSGLKLEFKV